MHDVGLFITCNEGYSTYVKVFKYSIPMNQFVENPFKKLKIDDKSLPSVIDINGDFLPDLIFDNDGAIKIAF